MIKRQNMTNKEKIKFASDLLQEAGVDFRIGNVSFVKASIDEILEDTKSCDKVVEALSRKSRKYLLGEIVHLCEIVKEKESLLSDVLDELHHSKQREDGLLSSIKEYQEELATLKKDNDKMKEVDIEEVVGVVRKALERGDAVVINGDNFNTAIIDKLL